MARLSAQDRRAQLLDTSAAVFARHGYTAATTAAIAEAAGVTEPIIYRHFKSKKDLFIALIGATGEEVIAAWKQDLTRTSGAAERVMRVVYNNPMLTDRGRMRYRVILSAMTEVDDAEIRAALRCHIETLHGFLKAEIESAQEQGAVTKRFSAHLSAWVLIQIAIGYGTLLGIDLPGIGHDGSGATVDDIIGLAMLGPAYLRTKGS
jgi:AcrR family transcriptional regulator